MRRLLRRHLVGLACLAVAGIVGVVAIADHRWKQERGNRAELAEWYCQHLGTRCGGASSAGIEARWNEREVGYKIVVTVLGAAGVILLTVRTVRMRH